MQFTTSLAVGLILGFVNLALWSGWAKSLLKKGTVNWGAFFVISMVKLAFLGGIIWVFLTKNWIEPKGFIIGFFCTTVITLITGLKWR